ncbi:MAG: hypothetical protein P8Y76_03645, partial [bacterium]
MAKFDVGGHAPRPDRAHDHRHMYCFVRKRRDSVFASVSPPDKEKEFMTASIAKQNPGNESASAC